VSATSPTAQAPPPEEAPSLRREAVSATRWSLVGVFGRQGVRFLFTLVLARAIGPDDFGVAAQAVVFITFITLFLDQGIGAALVQSTRLASGKIGAAFALNLTATVVCAAITFFAAGAIADFFKTEALEALLQVLAINVLVIGLEVVPRALLQRALRFRAIALAEVGGSILGFGSGIVVLALTGSYWAMVAQLVVADAVCTVWLSLAAGRHPLVGPWSELKTLLRFSLQVLGFGLVNYGARNADNVLVGRYLGPEPLALYSLAYRTLMVPVVTLSQVANRVALPVYARLQHDRERAARAYLESTGLIAVLSFPMMVATIVLAPIAVPVIFGSAWQGAVIPIQILAVTGMRQSIQSTIGPVLMGHGRPDLQLRWGLVSSTVYVASFVVGLQWGIIGVAAAYTIAGFLLGPFSFEIVRRILGFDVAAYWRVLLPAIAGSVAMGASAWAVTAGLELLGVGDVVVMMVGTVVAIGAYGACLRLWFPDAVTGVKAALRGQAD
jgi:O-antigen/teichoic acid export membrane protein